MQLSTDKMANTAANASIDTRTSMQTEQVEKQEVLRHIPKHIRNDTAHWTEKGDEYYSSSIVGRRARRDGASMRLCDNLLIRQ